MTPAASALGLLHGQFQLSIGDLLQLTSPPRFLARDLWARDASVQTLDLDLPPAGTDVAARGVSSMDGAGWSIRSFSSVDASGTATSWTVIGGRPGQDSQAALGPATHPGTPGNDVIAGGAGEDTVVGGLGDDTLSGGGGADTFLYTVGDGNDTITDFERGDDRLVLLGVTGVSLVSNGGVATVTLADGSQITLQSAAPTPSADVAPLG
jgi:Ca2+-binding RTX toxin-like protein